MSFSNKPQLTTVDHTRQQLTVIDHKWIWTIFDLKMIKIEIIFSLATFKIYEK